MKKFKLTLIKKIKSSKKGQAMVEFALILPILVLLLCGIIDFGWLFGNKLLTTYACREGARYGAVNATESNYATLIENKVTSVVPTFVSSGMTIVSTLSVPSAPEDGDITVNITYTFDLLTPFVSMFIGSQDYTVVSESTMKVE